LVQVTWEEKISPDKKEIFLVNDQKTKPSINFALRTTTSKRDQF
jgi:hypothetical protein